MSFIGLNNRVNKANEQKETSFERRKRLLELGFCEEAIEFGELRTDFRFEVGSWAPAHLVEVKSMFKDGWWGSYPEGAIPLLVHGSQCGEFLVLKVNDKYVMYDHNEKHGIEVDVN